jgi:transcriptional regulator with PAS, ATPase and Fis domain
MRIAFAAMDRAAQTDSTVLLEGETGTGKELAAQSIHLESARGERPFITVDCGAIPPQLIESELFGHERGAFTGAHSARKGAFQAASGGTLFLDEIGELSSELQPKLLRVLERREVKPIGSDVHVPVDVRLIAATNRDLRAEVNAKRFRADLYYRLAVLPIRLPPLRERLEDVPDIVLKLLEELGASGSDTEFLFTEDFLGGLAGHAWPGNIRELRNYIEQCIAFRKEVPYQAETAQRTEQCSQLDELIKIDLPFRDARQVWSDECERTYLERLLRHHDNNVTAAARTAGLGRSYLYRLLWRHGIK